MAALMIASIVAWGRNGSSVLVSNWAQRPIGGTAIARSIFNGVCLAFLGSTGILLLFNSPYHINQFLCAASYPGIECTPSYIENIHPTAYSPVIRNLLYGALILNAPLMLFVFAILPQETILSGANVLSVLADHVVGKWFRIVIVVDCIFVLAGGVLTGLFTVCGLVDRLSRSVSYDSRCFPILKIA